jgi:hypothetical protein
MHEFSLVTNDVKKEVYFFDPEGIRHELMFASHASLVNLML